MAVMEVQEARADHWPEIQEIYRLGIESGNSRFEELAPDRAAFDQYYRAEPRLVLLDGGRVTGWVAGSSISSRPVFAGIVELSVYVHPDSQGMGAGRLLIVEFVERAQQCGIWTVQANIFPENEASVRAHEAAGFRRVGIRERMGRMTHGPYAGQWRDVLLMERRSVD